VKGVGQCRACGDFIHDDDRYCSWCIRESRIAELEPDVDMEAGDE
jgi:hypothetical protein